MFALLDGLRLTNGRVGQAGGLLLDGEERNEYRHFPKSCVIPEPTSGRPQREEQCPPQRVVSRFSRSGQEEWLER